MTPTINRQQAAEICALTCLEQLYGISHAEVADTRIPELLHLASLIRAQTDQLDPATAGKDAIDAAVQRAVEAFTAEFLSTVGGLS